MLRSVRRLGAWACMLLCFAGPLRAGEIVFDTRRLSAAEADASTRLLDDARQRLPPLMRDALPTNLRLRWRDDLPARIHGRSEGRTIGLQRELLASWVSGVSPGQTGESPALRALLHELAHQFDRSTQGGLSRDPRLLDLAGWPRRAWPWGGRGAHNGFSERSPDTYERERPREFVAVNLEYFLLDPDYACRRPALFRYFSERLHWQPTNVSQCAAALPFVDPDRDETATLASLDPRRVYAIDYLLADANAQPMSRWGHSMLRLVICAPGRTPGPDCRLDLAHHRVLSFRAFVGDVQISSWRGLTGSYPSRLFLLPLDQVIDEYTRSELRGLQSIPLRLSGDEIAAVVERAAQVHWSYDGRYYFLGNNCAVETWRLLQDATPRLGALPLRSITPTGLRRKLVDAGVADASVLENPDEARRLGYYFEPMTERFGLMFEVARASLELPQTSVEQWFALSPERREPWLGKADLRATAALLVLEEAALRQQQLRARDLLKRRLLSSGSEAHQARGEVRDWLMQGEFLSRPASLVAGGYGLPSAIEREAIANEVAQRSRMLHERSASLEQSAREWLPEQQQRILDQIDRNLQILGDRLRALQVNDNESAGRH